MSTSSFQTLALRKQRLQQRSAQLRGALSIQSQATFGPTFRVIDRVREGGRWLWQHPLLLSGVAALLLGRRFASKGKGTKSGKGGLLVWAGRLLTMWRTWRQIQPLVTGKAKT